MYFRCLWRLKPVKRAMGSASDICLVWLGLVVVQLGFGTYPVLLVKFAKDKRADPLMFCIIRDGCCFPVLMLAAVIAEKKLMVPKGRDLPLFMVLGFLGMFCNQLLYLLGVYYTTADIASIFQPIIPVWAAILAIITKTEAPPPLRKLRGWTKITGILLSTIGAIIMTQVKREEKPHKSSSQDKKDSEMFLGYLFLLGNTFSMGLYIVIQRRLIFNKPDSPWRSAPVSVTGWSYFFGFIFMSIASLYYVNTPEKYQNIPKEAVLPLVYAVFITSALCYILITWCNMMSSPTVVTSSWPLQVLFCIVLAYIVLGEVMQPLQYFGGCFIIAGLLLVLWSNREEEKIKAGEGEKKRLITNDAEK